MNSNISKNCSITNNHQFNSTILYGYIKTLNTLDNFTSILPQDNNFNKTSIICDDEIKCNIKNKLRIYSQKLNMNQNILMEKLSELLTILPQLTLRDFIIKQKEKLYQLSIEEWFHILEFYLIYTSYDLKSRSIQKNTLNLSLSKAQYSMKQCRDKNCRFCYERLDLTKRFERAMNFSKNQSHQFVNYYKIYLNSNVICTTSNTIYVLTCTCHQYDYIGRCQGPFRDRIWQHRMNGCRIMSNFFIGSIVADRLQYERETNPIVAGNHMKLYRHSLECPIALQMFLKCQPKYWCFVPMTIEQAKMDNATLTIAESDTLTKYQTNNSTILEAKASQHIRDPILVRWCLDHVPVCPPNYQFSLRQKLEQYEFFRDRIDLFPTRYLDLYNAAIVTALPDNASDEMRHIVQSLLITYAKPKLNITVDHQEDKNSELESNTDYTYLFQHLTHPRLLLLPLLSSTLSSSSSSSPSVICLSD